MNDELHTFSHVEGKGYSWVVDVELVEEWLNASDDNTYDQVVKSPGVV